VREQRGGERRRAAARSLYIASELFMRGIRDKRKKGLRGRRNPLKRLDSDKEIQENPSLFPLIGFDQAWPGFAGFC
jgi:hypothetical protein